MLSMQSGMAAQYCYSYDIGSGYHWDTYFSSPAGLAAVNLCGACDLSASLMGYTDGNGNIGYQYSCTGFIGGETLYYKTVEKTVEIPGCSATMTYTDCVLKPQSNTDYCDNDYYWDDNHNCAACPRPSMDLTYYEDDVFQGLLIHDSLGGGDACGYGTRDSDSEGIESCVIGADPYCTYCDTSGCFQLTQDCPYVP